IAPPNLGAARTTIRCWWGWICRDAGNSPSCSALPRTREAGDLALKPAVAGMTAVDAGEIGDVGVDPRVREDGGKRCGTTFFRLSTSRHAASAPHTQPFGRPRYHAAMATLPDFPTEAATLQLPGPAGALELAVDPPDDDAAPLPLVAIICHPLPTEGGTMHNKVVTMAARALRELGATTVRFNFRGTGGSEGEFDQGDGELEDL